MVPDRDARLKVGTTPAFSGPEQLFLYRVVPDCSYAGSRLKSVQRRRNAVDSRLESGTRTTRCQAGESPDKGSRESGVDDAGRVQGSQQAWRKGGHRGLWLFPRQSGSRPQRPLVGRPTRRDRTVERSSDILVLRARLRSCCNCRQCSSAPRPPVRTTTGIVSVRRELLTSDTLSRM